MRWFRFIFLTFAAAFAGGGARSARAAEATPPPFGYTVRNWQSEEGLPQNTVNAILQTREGYLWLATLNGLARFDGVRFRVFGLRDGLLSVQTRCLYEDAQRNLWIGTYGGGLSRLKDGHVENWTQGTNLAANIISSIAGDAEDNVWIGTSSGLSRYHGGRLELVTNGLPSGSIRKLFTTRRGELLLATQSDGVFTWQSNRFVPVPIPFPVAKQKVAYCFLEDRQGRLWVSPGNGYLLCQETNGWRSYSQTNGVPFAYVTSLAESEDGTIWAGSLDAGLFSLSKGHFWPVRQAEGLPDDAIRCVENDQEGNLWVGTRAGGVSRLTRKRVLAYGTTAGLANEYARSVAVSPDGTVWVATTGGGLYRARDANFSTFVAGGTAEEYRFIESVICTPDGTLWWGGSQGLFSLSSQNILGVYAGASAAWLGGDSIQCMIKDGGDGIWIGTSLGQLRHFTNGVFIACPVDFGRVPCIALAQAPDGTLWIGTGGSGLLRFKDGRAETFSIAQGLESRVIRCLHLDREGVLWIGTGGGGLSFLQSNRVATVTTRDGLPDDTVSQILEDDSGNLWCGANNGLFRVSKRELRAVALDPTAQLHPLTLGKSDGMIAEECSGGSNPGCARLANGLLCFTTVRGIVVVDPASQKISRRPPPVLVEEVSLNGEPTAPRDLKRAVPVSPGPSADVRQVEVPPGTSNLEFTYSGLSFSAPNRMRFRYRMENLHEGWVEAGTRRTAYYTLVPPGHYRFHVTACNSDGIWNDTGATLAVIVHPHFWQTWWFLALLTLAAIGGITLFVRAATQRKYARQMSLLEMKAAIEQERTRIAKDIHDDLGANLTQITMLSEMGEAAPGNAGKAVQNFERIARRARLGVQSLDEIVWAVNPKNDTLPRLVDYLCRFADEIFESSPIRCWQEAPSGLPPWPVHAEARHNFFMAAKEAMNNALKHSRATEVWFNITLEDRELKLTLRDNGRGFATDQADFTRNGLRNMRARLTDIGGKFELQSHAGQGTTVTISIPLTPTS